MRARLQRYPLAVFLVVTFAVTWGAWLGLAAAGARVGIGLSPIYLLGLLGPMLGALVATTVLEGRPGLRDLVVRMTRLRIHVRWWAIAVGLPLFIAGATHVVLVAYAMFLLAPLPLPSWAAFGQFTGFPITNPIVLWLLLVLVNGYGEETGWRGFLLPTLQRRYSPLVSSVVVAGIWAAWHIPAFVINVNYRAMPVAMVPMFFLGLLCGSLLLTWLYDAGRQSIALVAVWHGTFNLVSGTVAARGALSAVESTLVMTIAVVLVARELVAAQHERHGEPAHHDFTPAMH
ncbi:MAG TPA: CPBP family intramembrane glutamic endopeptidase [Kofleriaceae bacterium]|nr:CPBP family intramembrane glutamic endopeptidase [Kofleriaceae bacterium]